MEPASCGCGQVQRTRMVWAVEQAVEEAAEEAVEQASEEVKRVDQACEVVEEEGFQWWRPHC